MKIFAPHAVITFVHRLLTRPSCSSIGLKDEAKNDLFLLEDVEVKHSISITHPFHHAINFIALFQVLHKLLISSLHVKASEFGKLFCASTGQNAMIKFKRIDLYLLHCMPRLLGYLYLSLLLFKVHSWSIAVCFYLDPCYDRGASLKLCEVGVSFFVILHIIYICLSPNSSYHLYVRYEQASGMYHCSVMRSECSETWYYCWCFFSPSVFQFIF